MFICLAIVGTVNPPDCLEHVVYAKPLSSGLLILVKVSGLSELPTWTIMFDYCPGGLAFSVAIESSSRPPHTTPPRRMLRA